MNDDIKVFPYLHDPVGNTNKYDIIVFHALETIKKKINISIPNMFSIKKFGQVTFGDLKNMKNYFLSINENSWSNKLEKTIENCEKNFKRFSHLRS